MHFEYDFVRGAGLFLASLVGAGLSLRVFLRWRHSTAVSRARRIVQRLNRPAATLSAVEEQSAAIEELIDFPDGRAAAEAARELLDAEDETVRSAAVEVLRQTRALDIWRRDLRRGGFRAKLRAIEALAEVGDDRAIDELLEALADDDPDVARAASRAICARDQDYGCERLALALASPNKRLAETAAATLVHTGESAIEHLLLQLTSLNTQARRLAIESLGNIGGEDLTGVLFPLLTTEPHPEVRAAAASALARVDGEVAVAEIQRLARYDPDWFVRARAYSLLAEMDTDGAAQYLLDGLAIFEPELDGEPDNGDNVVPVLEGTRRVRSAILAGLRLLGFTDDEIASTQRTTNAPPLTPEQTDIVSSAISLLRHRSPEQRAEGVRQLGEFGSAVSEPIVSALTDPDPYTRSEAAKALGKVGSRDAVDALAQCLKDPDPTVRLAATTALRSVVTREAARELTE